jgi:hypothetical protein
VVVDTKQIMRTCEGCQYYAQQTHLSVQALQTIPITWPFAIRGLDLVGPLKKAPGGYTHLLVAVDKLMKWIEARPIATIGSEQAVEFFLDIIHRFGVPNSIITDNGTQFTGKKFLSATITTSALAGPPWCTPHERAGRTREWHDLARTQS